MDWKFFLLVAGGGAVGSFLRALLGYVLRLWLPWPTLLVNILGAFLIGFSLKHWEQNGESGIFRAFWIVGLCGGFTTFSTFGVDALNFLKSAQWFNATAYISLNFFGTLLFILIGFRFYAWINP